MITPRRIEEHVKYRIMYAYGLSFIVAAFFFNDVGDLGQGMMDLLFSKSILLSDYLAVGNVGAAFINAGLLFLVFTFIAQRSKALMNGPLVASLFTVAGFALFGKNILNVWPIVLGVYAHSRIQEDHFAKYIIIAYFGTALSPLVSLISFGLDIPSPWSIVLGNVVGLIIGLILPPMASSFVRFHQGFNLYNIGFTSGVIGMLVMSVITLTGHEVVLPMDVYQGTDRGLIIYLFLFFVSMLVLFFVYAKKEPRLYKSILRQSGRLVTDFITLSGFGIALFNMGLMGLLSLAYVLLVGGHFSGPVIGGMLTVVGFASFGKHPKNTIPVILGVVLSTLVFSGDLSSTGAILTAFFGTTLAPIAGFYGPLAGLLAGFFHMALVSNLAILHGGVNLYNNGFSGGFVAASLIPIFESYKKEKNNYER